MNTFMSLIVIMKARYCSLTVLTLTFCQTYYFRSDNPHFYSLIIRNRQISKKKVIRKIMEENNILLCIQWHMKLCHCMHNKFRVCQVRTLVSKTD